MVMSCILALVAVALRNQVLAFALADASLDMPAAWRPPPDYSAGTSGHKTMYLASLDVGGTTFRLLVDTGSSLVVVPGGHCESRACAQHRRLRPDEGKLTGRTAAIGYGMGSIKGRMLKDKVCLPSPDGDEALDAIGFLQLRAENGCTEMSVLAADEESDDFASSSYDGILGLGLPDLDVFEGSCLMEKLQEAGQISSTDFSLRLGEGGQSELVLGGLDEKSLAGPGFLWVPLSPAAGSYWQFSIVDIAVNDKPLRVGRIDVLLDSGTSLISADSVLKNILERVASPSSCDSVNSLPKITLLIDGDISLPFLPADYVDRSAGECSLALMPGEFAGVNGQRMVLGDSFMRRYVTTFDRVNRRIGFGVADGDRFQDQLLPNMFPGRHTARPHTATSVVPSDVSSESDNRTQPQTVWQQSPVDASSNTLPLPTSPSMVSSASPGTTLKYDESIFPAFQPSNPEKEVLSPPSASPDVNASDSEYAQSITSGPNPEKEVLSTFPLPPLPPTSRALRGALPDINSSDVSLGRPHLREAMVSMFPPSPPSPTLPAASADMNVNDDDYTLYPALQPSSPQESLPDTMLPSIRSWLSSGASSDINSETNDVQSSTLGPPPPKEEAPDTTQPSLPSWTIPDVDAQQHDDASTAYRPLPVQALIKESHAESTGQLGWFELGRMTLSAATVPPADDPPPSDDPMSVVAAWQEGTDLGAKMKSVKRDVLLRNPYMTNSSLIQLHRVAAPMPAFHRHIVLPLVRSP